MPEDLLGMGEDDEEVDYDAEIDDQDLEDEEGEDEIDEDHANLQKE